MKRITILTAVLLATAAYTGNPGNNAAAAALAPSDTQVGVDLSGLDQNVKPGDNFDAYANGAWRAQIKIPADRSSASVFLEVFNKAEANTRAIITAALKANAASDSNQGRIANFYKAYVDSASIEKRGLTPIKPDLDAISRLKTKAELSRMLGADMRADEDPINATKFGSEHLFGLFVTQALSDPATTVPYVLQGGLGLPERDYYLSAKPAMVKIRQAYQAYIAQLLSLAGIDDAISRAQRIVDLETKIARAHTSVTESGQMAKGHDSWTKADFTQKAPGIDWDAYWKAAGLSDQQAFIAWQPKAVTGEAALVASEPLQSWQDWLTFHRINEVAQVLPEVFDKAHFTFFDTMLKGIPQQRTRNKRAIAAVNKQLGDAVGKLYVAQFFPASSKTDIEHMVKGILAAFDRRVADISWMAPATKSEARKKIATLHVGIGYPETWRDYAGLVIRADDPVGNLRRAALAEYHDQIAKIGKPVDRNEWWMTPQTVNAVNLPLQNALNFPAAILQAPFYDPKSDAAANFGSIGAVIGHEISHSFDNNGAMFDATGKLRNWWTAADLAHFKQAGEALAAQYSAYEPLPGVHINGEQVLGESIADVAGLSAAYEAYHASLNGKPAPVIDGLSGDQRFFLAFARSWRTKTRNKALRQQIATDAHAPGSYRDLTVRNLAAWYEAFNVTPGEKLYLAPDKRIHIW